MFSAAPGAAIHPMRTDMRLWSHRFTSWIWIVLWWFCWVWCVSSTAIKLKTSLLSQPLFPMEGSFLSYFKGDIKYSDSSNSNWQKPTKYVTITIHLQVPGRKHWKRKDRRMLCQVPRSSAKTSWDGWNFDQQKTNMLKYLYVKVQSLTWANVVIDVVGNVSVMKYVFKILLNCQLVNQKYIF